MTAALNNPKYEEIDLAQFDNDYAGQKVRVVVNPSRAFRAAYRESCSKAIFGADDAAFIDVLSVVLDKPAAEVSEYVNSLPPDAAQWLLFYTIDDYDANAGKFETSIPPHLFRVWDDWVIKRVKAHALLGAKSASSATKHNEETDAQTA